MPESPLNALSVVETSTLWAVTKGDYSDYHVLCVCPSKELAETVKRAYDGDEDSWGSANVEAMLFLNREPQKITTHHRFVTIWDEGTTTDQGERQRDEWEFDLLYPEDRKPVHWRWVRAPMHNGKGGRLEVSGTDPKRVGKVFTEKRAQLIADSVMRSRKEIRS